MNSTATTATVKTSRYVFPTDDVNNLNRYLVTETAPSYFKMGDGMFVARFERTQVAYMFEFTGRTRKVWGKDCPTFNRYAVDTVVIDDAVWGVKGERMAGTYAVNPDNVA